MNRVELNGQPWVYRTWGNPDRPALLLLHGFTGSHLSWSGVAPHWAERFWVIAPDLPGHQGTPAPADPIELSLPATSDRLAQLLDHLGLDKTAVIGYSMGGRQALDFSVRHPHRVEALVLESASPGLLSPAERAKRCQADRDLANRIESQGLEWFIAYWNRVPLFDNQSPAQRRRENRIRRKHLPWGLAQSLRGAGTGQQEPLWDRLGRVNIPVLLVTGSLDRKFCDIAGAMARQLPQCQWVVVDGAGHTGHIEQADQFLRHVDQFFVDLS